MLFTVNYVWCKCLKLLCFSRVYVHFSAKTDLMLEGESVASKITALIRLTLFHCLYGNARPSLLEASYYSRLCVMMKTRRASERVMHDKDKSLNVKHLRKKNNNNNSGSIFICCLFSALCLEYLVYIHVM